MGEINQNEDSFNGSNFKIYDHTNHCYKIDTSTYEGVELLYQTFIADQNKSFSSVLTIDEEPRSLFF